jgi:hypothetical protein
MRLVGPVADAVVERGRIDVPVDPEVVGGEECLDDGDEVVGLQIPELAP